MTMNCQHTNLSATVQVSHLNDTGRWLSEIKISCAECGIPFAFKGLPIGANLDGAAVSANGTEARIAVEPVTNRELKLKAIFIDGPARDRTMDIPERIPVLKVPFSGVKRASWNGDVLENGACVAVYELQSVNWGFGEATYALKRLEP
jgi:hypothetical protein